MVVVNLILQKGLPFLHGFTHLHKIFYTLVILSVELVEEIKTTLDILKELSLNQLEPQDFETIRPTLDDVFIALTKG
ncbi:hypothetical protein AJQ09_00535 [Listeria seeligeri]|uniref:ABC transporter ATP-binding protein n=1 Tax=Listeria seeligeri TaxID=1640 RepID=A0ABR5E4W8_LISSE|nr:hypothetical protein UQ68_10630 [Listeria seeligeri]OLQ24658.1 hypothetical protein AJQ09_00535 [Listeria seeligeri]